MVDMSTSTYPFKCYLETLLSYNADAKNTHLETSFFYKEKPGTEAYSKLSQGEGGYKDRSLKVKNEKKLYFSTQIYVDFFNTRRFLPPGVEIKLRFVRNQDSFSIVTESATKYKIKVYPKLKLIVRKIVPSEELLAKHQSLFKNNSAKFPFCQSKITTHLVAKGVEFVDLQLCRGVLPSQILLCMLDHRAYNSNIKINPFHFKNYDLSNVCFKVDGENALLDGFKLDFDSGDYMRLYRNLLDCVAVGSDNAGIHLTMENFKSACCIVAHSRSPDLCNFAHTHNGKPGTINVSLSFKKTLEESISILS